MNEAQKHYRALRQRAFATANLLSDPATLATRIYRRLDKEGYVANILNDRFGTAGASSGTPWRPLAPRTILERQKHGFGPGPILIRSGTLFKAMLEGKRTYSAHGIKLTMKDTAAPRYIGGGKIRKKKLKGTAEDAEDLFSIVFRRSNRVSDYAGRLNADRPFANAPTAQELEPMRIRGGQLVREFWKRAMNGESFQDII